MCFINTVSSRKCTKFKLQKNTCMFFYTVLLYIYTLYKQTRVIIMQNVVRLPITDRNQAISESAKSKVWSYLLADSVAFNKDVDYGIRIQKPSEEKMPRWIEKLIISGQCNSIYVENLSLKENEKNYIEGLCHKHNVSLFSLSVVQEKNAIAPSKVVRGPWL